jgi:hypothetical protein
VIQWGYGGYGDTLPIPLSAVCHRNPLATSRGPQSRIEPASPASHRRNSFPAKSNLFPAKSKLIPCSFPATADKFSLQFGIHCLFARRRARFLSCLPPLAASRCVAASADRLCRRSLKIRGYDGLRVTVTLYQFPNLPSATVTGSLRAEGRRPGSNVRVQPLSGGILLSLLSRNNSLLSRN